jgi:tryptophan halogenase
MSIPDTLKDTIELFRSSGRFFRNADEMFGLVSWVEVMLGQGIMPQAWHPLVDQLGDADLAQYIDHVGKVIAACVDAMPPHQAFIDRYCVADKVM